MDVIRKLPEIFAELAQKKQQSFLTLKEYKDKGIPVIGAYCSYFPRELALAMGRSRLDFAPHPTKPLR